jgi:ribosomal-protein-alanine N-acetyltransferase
MVPTLETRRLILKPLELADAPQIQQLFPQWEIVKYLNAASVPWPYPEDGALTYCRDIALPEVERGESWYWTLRAKPASDEIIGLISLSKHPVENRGFWLAPHCQGKGLMTEACDTVTEYWFEVLNFPVLRVPKAIANVASRRISQNQGMRVIATEEKEYVCGELLSETWEITAEEWRERRRAK